MNTFCFISKCCLLGNLSHPKRRTIGYLNSFWKMRSFPLLPKLKCTFVSDTVTNPCSWEEFILHFKLIFMNSRSNFPLVFKLSASDWSVIPEIKIYKNCILNQHMILYWTISEYSAILLCVITAYYCKIMMDIKI